MSAPNSDGVLTRTVYSFCENVSARRHCNKVSDRRHQERVRLSAGAQVRCYGTLAKLESVAFNESVFGGMLGYGDVSVAEPSVRNRMPGQATV